VPQGQAPTYRFALFSRAKKLQILHQVAAGSLPHDSAAVSGIIAQVRAVEASLARVCSLLGRQRATHSRARALVLRNHDHAWRIAAGLASGPPPPPSTQKGNPAEAIGGANPLEQQHCVAKRIAFVHPNRGCCKAVVGALLLGARHHDRLSA